LWHKRKYAKQLVAAAKAKQQKQLKVYIAKIITFDCKRPASLGWGLEIGPRSAREKCAT